MSTILLICLLGALLEMDTTYAFQLTFSRGIIAGPILALLSGDLMTGLQVGIFTELLFADVHPLGGLLPPSAAICCTITLVLTMLHVPVYFAFFFGVIGAILFSMSEVYMRKRRSVWLARQEQKILKNPAYVTRAIVQDLGVSFLATFFFVFIFSTVMGFAMVQLLPHLTEKISLAARFSFMAVPWIGLVTLVSSFRLKTR